MLAGLSHPIRALSFEYLPWALDYARQCVNRIEELGSYRFNWSPGEAYRMAAAGWLTGQELSDQLQRADAQRVSGDVYARLESEAL